MASRVGIRDAAIAFGLAAGCSSYSPPPVAPTCTPGCGQAQVCVTVCLDGGAKGTQCAVTDSNGAYVATDGGVVYVCSGF